MVLDLVQVFDQEVALTRFCAEQGLDVGECLRIDAAALRGFAFALAAGADRLVDAGDRDDGVVQGASQLFDVVFVCRCVAVFRAVYRVESGLHPTIHGCS